jgi:cytochrome b
MMGERVGRCSPALSSTRVWDLGVRLFHWLLVAAIATALVTGLSGPRNWLNVHIAAGAAIGGLVAFRILWGFVGSTYARFSGFPVRPSAIKADLAGLVAGRRPQYLGHNPLGSLMALALLAIALFAVMTGVVTLGGVDKQGPLAFVTSYRAGNTTQGVHQALAYGLLALIAGHLLGVAYESAHGQRDLVRAMITGKKAASVAPGCKARPEKARPILAALVMALLLAAVARGVAVLSARPALGVPAGLLDPTYAQECGSCHMAYPPSLAPSWRWIAILADLSDHFGEDASLEPDVAARIRAYLTKNSAEKWDTRAAHELQRSNPEDPLRLTATPFWTRVHRQIPDAVFRSKAVRAKGACNACHTDASTGRFDPQKIEIPARVLQ